MVSWLLAARGENRRGGAGGFSVALESLGYRSAVCCESGYWLFGCGVFGGVRSGMEC
jgi:hypothetical protein